VEINPANSPRGVGRIYFHPHRLDLPTIIIEFMYYTDSLIPHSLKIHSPLFCYTPSSNFNGIRAGHQNHTTLSNNYLENR
jgi:hypothetical protein